MRLTEFKLRQIIKGVLVETIPDSYIGKKQPYISQFSMEESKKLVTRFGEFLDKQKSLHHLYFDYYVLEKETSGSYPSEYIELGVIVYEKPHENVQFYGIHPGKLFQGTKLLKHINKTRTWARGGTTANKAIVKLDLHDHGWTPDERRDEIYRELEQWLDANENKQFPRERFGIPEVTKRARNPRTGGYSLF